MNSANAQAERIRRAVRRFRHIHCPDMPPCYLADMIPRQLHKNIEKHIREVARRREDVHQLRKNRPYWYNPDVPDVSKTRRLEHWLKYASPPLVVLSFTPRPTFQLQLPPFSDDDDSDDDDSDVAGELKKMRCQNLNVAFPKPPGWSAAPWFDLRQIPKVSGQLEKNGLLFSEQAMAEFDPARFSWSQVRTTRIRLHKNFHDSKWHQEGPQPVYKGPGILCLRLQLDVIESPPGPTREQKIAEFHQALERTTISVLEFEYGLNARSLAGSSGLWLETRHKKDGELGLRQVATITCAEDWGVASFEVLINVGQPTLAMVRGDEVDDDDHDATPKPEPAASASTSWPRPRSRIESNPWARIGQQNTVTSVVAELTTDTQKRAQELGGPSKFLRYQFTPTAGTLFTPAAGTETCGYSTVHWKGKNVTRLVRRNLRKEGDRYPAKEDNPLIPAPLGLDNFDLASAWASELAAQLGIEEVEQLATESRDFETGRNRDMDRGLCEVSQRRTMRKLPRPLFTESLAAEEFIRMRRSGDLERPPQWRKIVNDGRPTEVDGFNGSIVMLSRLDSWVKEKKNSHIQSRLLKRVESAVLNQEDKSKRGRNKPKKGKSQAKEGKTLFFNKISTGRDWSFLHRTKEEKERRRELKERKEEQAISRMASAAQLAAKTAAVHLERSKARRY